MSVLIKNMEMPKSCNKCTFGDGYACYATGRTVQDEDWETTRSASCPLIELPPHGRLIDADALEHDLEFDIENDQRALDQMDFVGKERALIQFDKDCKQNCIRYLSEASTIIPAEEGER